ncbi:hypothetical protein MY3296_001992 [Beauveria thailandica]
MPSSLKSKDGGCASGRLERRWRESQQTAEMPAGIKEI